MTDDLAVFAQLRPTEPALTAAQRDSLRVAVFGATSIQDDDRRLCRTVRSTEASARADSLSCDRLARDPGPRREAGRLGHDGAIRAWPRRAATLAASLLVLVGMAAGWNVISSNPTYGVVVDGHGTGTATALEPIRFEYAMSSTAATDRAILTSVDRSGACYTVTLASGNVSECVDADTIVAGYAWSVYGRGDDPAVLVGVVPDEVDTVLVNGLPVDRAGNIWSITLPDTSIIEVHLGDSRTDRWVSADLRNGTPPLVSTTTTDSLGETTSP